ncbi:MAG TPA: S-layer homology domain-containing protein, partial [Clostridia bacterium]
STTIKAIAVKEGMADSEVATFNYTINITGTDTKVGGGGGGGGPVPTLIPTPAPVQPNKVENGKVTTIPVLDASSKQASASISSDDIKNALSNAEADENGIKVVGISVQKVDGASGYVQEIPFEELTKAENSQNLKITTELGSVTAPSNMLAETAGNGQKVSLAIVKADSSGIAPDVAAQIGTRPVVELNVKVDGSALSWSNEEAPVAISIPYAPSSEEKSAPEHITVLYINSSGAVSPVPSARYDSTTGQVTFKTTHFSKYAVAFVEKTFEDMDQYGWAKNSVEIMASKGVINGTSAASYTPGASVKRGDFMLLLVKALGLTAKPDGRFADVNDSDYYAGAIAVARKLGIAKGSGDGRFNPQDSITRQDMMTLIERAMKVAGKKMSVSSGTELDAFGDREKVAEYAKDSVAALVKNGIVTGSGNNINPMGNATRAETAVLIYRIYNK